MAGKGGGAWKVAYADFVTAMMAFFLVMWLVASSNKPTKEAIASYFRDPFAESLGKDGAATGGGGPPISEGASKEIRVALSSPGPKGSMQAKSDDPEALAARQAYLLKLHDGARTTVGTVVTFVEDSAELDEAALARLTELAPLMRGKPNKIEIRGHSSKRPLPEGSPFPDTWKLCYARCKATMEFLEQHGLEPERMRLSQAGAFEPHTQSVEREAQARNARVEVYLLGEHVEDLKGTRKEREKRVETEKSGH